jgi:hypothetical protein
MEKTRTRYFLVMVANAFLMSMKPSLIWDGDYLTIPIDEADSEPLVGMSLMEGYQLHSSSI